jgi:glycosyltransferase involved in cell wall biosynthesis
LTIPGAEPAPTFPGFWRWLTNSRTSRHELSLGARFAAPDLILALLRHQSDATFILVASPDRAPRVRRQLNCLEPAVRQRVSVCTYFDLSDRFDPTQVHAWIDPYGVLPAPFSIRNSLSQRCYPVLSSHHTVSYQHLLDEQFLPLLFSRTLPCDSFVCSSSPARTAIRNLLERMKESLAEQHGLQLSYNGRMDVIPLGVDTDLFAPRAKALCRRRFGLPQKALIVLCFGRLSATDKADLFPLVEAWGEVRRYFLDQELVLVIAGTGRQGYDKILKNALRRAGLLDSVRIIDGVDDRERSLLYGAADVFVSPADSIQESFGIAPVEAMACGIPQLVSDWDGYRDTVLQGETGFLVSSYWMKCDSDVATLSPVFAKSWESDHFRLAQSVAIDFRELVAKLKALLANKHLRETMSEASRRRALSHYDHRVIASRYQELLFELTTIAGQISYCPNGHTDYRCASYFDNFSHFATSLLDDSTILGCTERGKKALPNGISLPYRNTMDGLEDFSKWRINAVLRACREPVSIRVAVASIVAEIRCNENLAKRQLMWLLKYGYLQRQRDVDQ